MSRRSTAIAATSLLAVGGLVLSACAGSSTPSGAPVSATPATDAPESGEMIGDGHGAVEGAVEVAEPPLHLLTLDEVGAADQLDLLDESVARIGEVGAVTSLATDGRFVFADVAPTSATGASVVVVDSGFWTWSHIDHFHYYRGTPAVLGAVDGTGPATIATGTAATGLFFAESGEAVVLETAALADGELGERLRLEVEPHAGLVAGVGTGAVLTRADDSSGDATPSRSSRGDDGDAAASRGSGGGSTRLSVVGADGVEVGSVACTNARGAIETVVGVAVGCDEGAVLAVAEDSGAVASLELIGYPEGAAAAPAGVFRNREGRPTVAGVSSGAEAPSGIWLLDTRERSWQLLDAGVPLLQATAVDDAAGHVLALAADGRVLVLSAETGATLAATEPLLPETLADPQLLAGVELLADQQRAYLNAPAEHRVYEIDFADAARISRVFDTPTAPLHVAGTGR